jgi:hypothetical protein
VTKSWVPKGKLIKHMRKTSMGHKPRTDAKNACKIDKATYQCNLCDQIIYEGKSQKNFEKLQETYPDIIMDKFHMDHIQPVVMRGNLRRTLRSYKKRILTLLWTSFTWITFSLWFVLKLDGLIGIHL